jgi:hypothetical protein
MGYIASKRSKDGKPRYVGQRLDELVLSKNVLDFPTRTTTKNGKKALSED